MSTAISRKLESIRTKSAMKSAHVADLLSTRPETVSRWNQGRATPAFEKEQLLLSLEYIVDQLSDIYQPDEARHWLYSPQKLLDGHRPADLIKQGDVERVLEIIEELNDGVFL